MNIIYKKNPELYQLYIEMKHKDINNTKSFSNDVLKNIKDTISIEEAKIKFISLLLSYFNISDDDENSKQIIVNLANQEFVGHISIYEIKKKQLSILNYLFNRESTRKNNEEIKNYVGKNNLEELIKRTFPEADKNKLGYLSFDEMRYAINEANLNDFYEEILLMTKSEIFNRFDYYNFLILFNTESNSNTDNKTDEAKTEINNINNNDDKNNNINVINSDSKENNTDNNKGEKTENKEENSKEKKEENNQNTDNKESHENDKLEKKLKLIVHKIKIEGGTPVNYFSQLKEKININTKEYEIINLKKLKEFLSNKSIELNDEEIKQLKVEYGLGQNEEKNSEDFIIYENFEQKLLKIIQNDSDNDDDFIENIPKLDFIE